MHLHVLILQHTRVCTHPLHALLGPCLFHVGKELAATGHSTKQNLVL